MRKIDSQTQIYGLIGYPLNHSHSPLLHNDAFQQLNLNYRYLPLQIEPEQLKEGIRGIRALGIRGVNVTIPYKERVIPLLDKIDPLAEEIGAVNTIVNKDGLLTGYNTDASGFYCMLKQDGQFEPRGKKAVLIGAGGAARAVGTMLCKHGLAELVIINRTQTRAQQLISLLQQKYPRTVFSTVALEEKAYFPLIEEVELLIDTTPIGTFPHHHTVPVIKLPDITLSHLLAIDLVYNPPLTVFLREAAARGAATLNGQTMLLYQAADAFELWTGIEPDLTHWREIIKKA